MKTFNVCNLARLPMSMEDNPLYKTSLQILENNNIYWKDTELYDFYKKYNPKNLGDIFKVSFLSHEKFDKCFLPWLQSRPMRKFRETAFIEYDVGKKVKKLKKLIESIKTNGYNPKAFPDRKGGITGYCLSNGNVKKLYIVSGNHRAAVLTALGIPIVWGVDKPQKPRERFGIKVDFDNFPKIFKGEDVKKWPSVKSGYLSENQAVEILNVYLEV